MNTLAFEIASNYADSRNMGKINSKEQQNSLLCFINSLEKKNLKFLMQSFYKILIYKQKAKIFQNQESKSNKDLIETFYKRQIKKHLSRVEKRLKFRVDLQRNRTYLRIIAFSKALKFSSPFKRPLNSPMKTPPFTPEKFRHSMTVPRIDPLLYPLCKFVGFIMQNHFVVKAKYFKQWKIQEELEQLDFL